MRLCHGSCENSKNCQGKMKTKRVFEARRGEATLAELSSVYRDSPALVCPVLVCLPLLRVSKLPTQCVKMRDGCDTARRKLLSQNGDRFNFEIQLLVAVVVVGGVFLNYSCLPGVR